MWKRCCMVPPNVYMVPHTLYGIGIWWSLLPYMEQVLYGPPTCTYGLTHMYDLIFPPYLIQNRYHVVPPHVWYDFFRPALKESAVCPNNDMNTIVHNNNNNHINYFLPCPKDGGDRRVCAKMTHQMHKDFKDIFFRNRVLWRHILIAGQKRQQAIAGITETCGICTTEAIQRRIGVSIAIRYTGVFRCLWSSRIVQ